MWTWDNYNSQLSRLVDDVEKLEYDNSIRLDALNAALRAMIAYRPIQASAEYSDASTITVPTDCYRVVCIYANDSTDSKTLYEQRVMDVEQDARSDSYFVWDGVIDMGREWTTATLYYETYYPDMYVGILDIPVPTWAEEAVLYRAAAYLLAPALVARARLGAFHDRQDAPPEQNSLIQAADWFVLQFQRIMTEHKGTV